MNIRQYIWYATLGHNPFHSFKINYKHHIFHVCSRCLGGYIGFLISLPMFLLLWQNSNFDFWTIFLASWFLAFFAIIDWSSVKLNIWAGDNRIRTLTGFLLGCSAALYLLLLPVPLIYRLTSLWLYGFVFTIIQYFVYCRKSEINPFDFKSVKDSVSKSVPLAVVGPCACGQTGGCGNCCTCCPCANMCGCCCSPIGVCIPCTCLGACLVKKMLDGMEKKQ